MRLRQRATPLHVDEHAALLGELAELRKRVEALEARHVRRDDRVVLIAIGESVRGRVFSAAELFTHATNDPTLADALRGLTAKRLGKYLRTLANRPLAGLMLQRVGRDRDGSIWAVQVVGDLHRGSSVLPREGA